MRRIMLLISLVACTIWLNCYATESLKEESLCDLFKQNPQWQKATISTQKKWSIPISMQMAFIHQESGFVPASTKAFHGYAQSTRQIWQLYQNETGTQKSPNDFAAASDFIGWYSNKVAQKFSIKPTDVYSVYLVYQQGLGGSSLQGYQKNKTSTNIARKVVQQSKLYEQQLKNCPIK